MRRKSPFGSAVTGAELRVLECLARGLSTKQISYELGTAISTIENQRISIMQRSGTRGAVELGVWSVRNGHVPLEKPARQGSTSTEVLQRVAL